MADPTSTPLDISALTQPGPSAGGPMPAPNAPAPPADAMTPAMQAPGEPGITPGNNQINPAQPPAPPVGATAPPAGPPPPHARLAGMVEGLMVGLSAAGKSLSTHGKEGGAEDVQNYYAQKQQMQQSATAAAQAQKNAQLQGQLLAGNVNEQNARNYILMQSVPDEITQAHLKTAEAGTTAAQSAFNLFANTGMTPTQINQLTSGGPVDAKTSSILQANAQQQLRIASQLLPSNNPALSQLQKALDSGNPAALVQANNRLQAELKGQENVNDAAIKKAAAAAAAPFGDKAAMVNDAILRRMQVNHPEITSLPAGYAMTADSTPKDLDRVDKLLLPTEQAEATKANREIVNGMRQQMMDLAQGAKIPGDPTKEGTDYVSTLPVGLQGTIKSIGEGRAAPPPAGSRSPAAQTILGALNRAYPDYDASKYPSYTKARTNFTSGPEAKGINAINTVETHLARMYAHATAPNTSGGITGKITGFFGDKDVRALDIDRTAVSTELSKAYAAGQISEGEVRDWEKKLDFTQPGMTTGKLITNLQEIDGLLEGKQRAYETQWATASPSASIVSPVPIISPDAASARAVIRGEQPPAQAASPTTVPANGNQPTGSDPFAQFGGKRHQP